MTYWTPITAERAPDQHGRPWLHKVSISGGTATIYKVVAVRLDLDTQLSRLAATTLKAFEAKRERRRREVAEESERRRKLRRRRRVW